jgi:hypothetical protein
MLPRALPDRSVETLIASEAPDGITWPLVLTGVALPGAVAAARNHRTIAC